MTDGALEPAVINVIAPEILEGEFFLSHHLSSIFM